MDEARYALLKAEVEDLYGQIDQIYARIEERHSEFGNRTESLDSMGYQLHNLYCAFEQVFEIIAQFFENNIAGERYHTDLLRRMRLTIEGIRPACISEEAFTLLDELRRFRHFFRHAYLSELDFEKLAHLVEIAEKVRVVFQRDSQRFFEKLKP
jgi:hypothetical protein